MKVITEKGSWQSELKVRRKDSSTYDVMAWANLVTDNKGRPVCLMTSIADITERKKAEQLNEEF